MATVLLQAAERPSACAEVNMTSQYARQPGNTDDLRGVAADSVEASQEPASDIRCVAASLDDSNALAPFGSQPCHGISTYSGAASCGDGEVVRDDDQVDDTSTTSPTPLVKAQATSPMSSSGILTPQLDPSSCISTPPHEEAGSRFLPPGLTTDQLWNFVVNVSGDTKPEGVAGKAWQNTSCDEHREASCRALVASTDSLNAPSVPYELAEPEVEETQGFHSHSTSSALFDSALFDGSASRVETIGSRVGLYRRPQLRRPHRDGDCYARQYPQRSPLSPDCVARLPMPPPVSRATRSTAKRSLPAETTCPGAPKDTSIPSLPALKRRRGSQDSGKGNAMACPPRELGALLHVLAEHAKQVAHSPEGAVPAVLDCSFWKELQEQMSAFASQERKASATSDKRSCPPQFLSRVRVACSTCPVIPHPNQNAKKHKKRHHDPTRPGLPLPSPRCVPKFLTVPLAAYRVPAFRQYIYQWIASQAGTPVETLERLRENSSEEVPPLPLPRGLFFSSRVTDRMNAEEEAQLFFTGYVPSAGEEASAALEQQDNHVRAEEAKGMPTTDEFSEDSVLAGRTAFSFGGVYTQCKLRATCARDGVYYDREGCCWKATVQRRNRAVSRRFKPRCSQPERHPQDILYERVTSASMTLRDGHHTASPGATTAELYYDWVSKHFKEVCQFLESTPAPPPENQESSTAGTNGDSRVPAKGGSHATSSVRFAPQSGTPQSKAAGRPVSSTSCRLINTSIVENTNILAQLMEPLNRREAGTLHEVEQRMEMDQIPFVSHSGLSDSHEQSENSVCCPEVLERHSVLRQCQRLLTSHRRQLSDHLLSQRVASLQSSPTSRRACPDSSLPLPRPKEPEQTHQPSQLSAAGHVVQKLQEMIRDTLGTVSTPPAGNGSSRYLGQIRLLQQLRKHHQDMQRLIINTASGAERQERGCVPGD
ncbi:AP2 domain transcription factor AP2IX-4 [Besnoitia besnoiti]|uniref:AP2 domain transcription factor AP2IX-4 n=1 Tax=Besnoitia besnoiti TaxID=94643 RepID=A0A2A9M0N9_BESBE|nr:AP2 domain transcription factor AP2IX-4 [Besnoitia besnoiti]PFH32158.1 AP2 domain transcription factor AP2IX-4 [Besnoitia besnoiti]